MGRVEETAAKIKALKIQGANAIAVAALKALADDLANDPGAHKTALVSLLVAARPNEPMLRNLLNRYLSELPAQAAGADFPASADSLLECVRRDERLMAEAGAELVQDGMRVFTHCHSSSVVSILREAHGKGRKFTVLNTETRPRLQGRITARELAGDGIKVVHMVDSAAKYALDGADLFLFGADAVLHSGYLINKVGTGIFCVVANRYDVPTYCATLTLKVVRDHVDEKVEERDPSEVWPDAPGSVKIFNPAFDKVHLKYVTAFITERGLLKNILSGSPLLPPSAPNEQGNAF